MAFGKKTKSSAEARIGDRQAVAIPATARLGTGDRMPIQIADLSTSGLRASIATPVAPGMLLRIGLPIGRSPHARVVWYDGEQMGCAFLANIEAPEFAELITEMPETLSA